MQRVFDAVQYAETVTGLAGRSLEAGNPGVEAARAVQAYAEKTLQAVVGTDAAIACEAGCSHCCIVNVAVLQPEAENIVAYLINGHSEAELLDLYQALSKLDRETGMLDDEERIMSRRQCAFLDHSGNCGIYPVRPLLCRAVTSIDARTCRDALTMIAFGENRPIVSNLLHREIFETAFCHFGDVLRQKGLEHRSLRLTGAIRALLPQKIGLDPIRREHAN